MGCCCEHSVNFRHGVIILSFWDVYTERFFYNENIVFNNGVVFIGCTSSLVHLFVVYCDYFDSPQTFHGIVCMCVACSILLSAAVCSLYSSYTLLLYCLSGVLMSAVFMCSGSFLILYIKSHALYSD